MNALSKQHVVTQLTSELAARRRAAMTRRAAYLALAQAILADKHDVFVLSPALDRHPTSLVQVPIAA